jgi:hypothetical protein
MSYSFSLKAVSKSAAKSAVAAEFDKVIESQPIHARDKEAALASAGAVIDLLADGDPRNIAVSVNGSLGWTETLRDDASNPLQSASVSVSAYYTI